jgi:hypothetical protein
VLNWARNFAFSLLLVWSLLTSLCVLCPKMQPAPHDCCHHESQKQCPGHETAFDSTAKVDAGQPVVIVGAPLAVAPEAKPVSALRAESDLLHPPPDRLLLNSVLLI